MDFPKMRKLGISMFEKYTAKQIRRLTEDKKLALQDARRRTEDIAAQREMLRIYKAMVKEILKPVKWPKMPRTYVGQDGKKHRLPKGPMPVPARPARAVV